MQAEINNNPLPDHTTDWWRQNTSGVLVYSKAEENITPSGIWIASVVAPLTDAPDIPNQVAFIDPSTGDTGRIFDLDNQGHLDELRLYKPLPKGFRLILTQD